MLSILSRSLMSGTELIVKVETTYLVVLLLYVPSPPLSVLGQPFQHVASCGVYQPIYQLSLCPALDRHLFDVHRQKQELES